MGNRAVITTKQKRIGIYLHWNGGFDSVQAFLKYCELKGYRCPENDSYGWARLCQVIANFFGGELSVGIGPYDNLDLDNGDNGVYIIENWRIVDREFFEGREQNEYPLIDMLKGINEKMPIEEQIDIDAELKKSELIDRLHSLAKHASEDKEKAHIEADKLLLEYITDRNIKSAFEQIDKWYA